MVGIERGAQVNGHAGDVTARKIGNVRLFGNLIAQVGVLDVLHDADDLHVGLRSGIHAKTDVAANRVAASEVTFDEGLVHDDFGGHPIFFGWIN